MCHHPTFPLQLVAIRVLPSQSDTVARRIRTLLSLSVLCDTRSMLRSLWYDICPARKVQCRLRAHSACLSAESEDVNPPMILRSMHTRVCITRIVGLKMKLLQGSRFGTFHEHPDLVIDTDYRLHINPTCTCAWCMLYFRNECPVTYSKVASFSFSLCNPFYFLAGSFAPGICCHGRALFSLNQYFSPCTHFVSDCFRPQHCRIEKRLTSLPNGGASRPLTLHRRRSVSSTWNSQSQPLSAICGFIVDSNLVHVRS